MPWKTAPGLNLREIAMTSEQTICLNTNRNLGNRTRPWGYNHTWFADEFGYGAAA
jgi:hypothetical protein